MAAEGEKGKLGNRQGDFQAQLLGGVGLSRHLTVEEFNDKYVGKGQLRYSD
jgi:hypothetical protein